MFHLYMFRFIARGQQSTTKYHRIGIFSETPIVRRLTCTIVVKRNYAVVCNGQPLKNLGNVVQGMKRSFLNDGFSKELWTPNKSRYFTTSTSHSEDNKLIYTGNLGKAVIGVKMFSYSSSVFSLSMMPYIFLKSSLGLNSVAMQVVFFGIISFFTFLTPVLLHLITKGYVVRLYHNHNTDTYTAVTYNVLLLEKKTVFQQRDVRVPDVSRMFTSFFAKNTSLLVNPMLFQFPQDYNHLMGYDKPFTFDMDD